MFRFAGGLDLVSCLLLRTLIVLLPGMRRRVFLLGVPAFDAVIKKFFSKLWRRSLCRLRLFPVPLPSVLRPGAARLRSRFYVCS